ncbi:MAG: ferritin-like domain-containing protein [Crocinitomicaceae bacterium]|nr:ferritin-like domain-containing protein [Crocinitomicaceae bacterium]
MENQRIQQKLQKAVELEFATIPPYLAAWFSIAPGTNTEASSIIRSVFMEEMLHMILAANVLNSVGGKVQLNKDTIPQYPLLLDFDGKLFRDREFEVNLERLSPASLCTFLQIELPDGWDWQKDHPKACKPDKKKSPDDSEFEVSRYTIGDFYDEIKADLKALVAAAGGDESKVFIGDEEHQIDVNFYWKGGGLPVKVTNLETAFEAIDVIKEQGEGATETVLDGDHEFFGQDEEVAHFYRFNEVLMEQYYQPNDDPKNPPTGDKFTVDYDAVSPIKTNATSIDYLYTPVLDKLNNEFNSAYTLMLQQLELGLTGQPHVLFSAIINGMRGLAPIAYEMANIPIYQSPSNEMGAPSFEWLDNGLDLTQKPKSTNNTKSNSNTKKDKMSFSNATSEIHHDGNKVTLIISCDYPAGTNFNTADKVWDIVADFSNVKTIFPVLLTNTLTYPDQTESRIGTVRDMKFGDGQTPVKNYSHAAEKLTALDHENRSLTYISVAPETDNVTDYQGVMKVVGDNKCTLTWTVTYVQTPYDPKHSANMVGLFIAGENQIGTVLGLVVDNN